MEIISYPSANFNARDGAVPLQFIVLHYTGMKTGAAALERLSNPEAKVSAHYLIEENGQPFALINENERAWHAGKSYWRGVSDLNSASIGIELVNPGHQFGYRPFPKAQIEAVLILIDSIVRRWNLDPIFCLLAHSDIAPGRKEDPGEFFPWQKLAEEGFGMWPEPTEHDYQPTSDLEVQQFLRIIGYQCPDHGDYDRATREALLAFQRHFEPNNLTGTPERETVARLRALVRLQAQIKPEKQNVGLRRS